MLQQKKTEQPPQEEVRAGLKKIMASSGFATSERVRGLLSLVVNKALEGEGETVKEYLVGVEVFDRVPSFDPRTDTMVRVEARRLRKKLEDYYAGEGKSDLVRITLPLGS